MMDSMTVADVLNTLKKISEDPMTAADDLQHINDAITSLENITKASNDQQDIQAKKDMVSTDSGVADTSLLTGPIGGLKNFLMKTQRDNEK